MSEKEESFRDRLVNVTEEGKRRWIFPRKPKGKFYNLRTIFSIIQIVLLFGLPFVKVNGNPLILMNFFERKFIILGFPFGPHDFYLLGLSFIASLVFIILFTVVFGRIFCGWFCPQTLFMELIFRKIEYWIDGNCGEQEKLVKAPLNFNKFIKRLTKYLLFFIICFAIVNIVISYIIGVDRVIEISLNPFANTGVFAGIVLLSFILFLEYVRFREQLCTIICPYGRLQGVLLDQNSIVIAYDYKRGEPRNPFTGFGINRSYGDCIDCKSCVAVCPTGIDIRNGTQLECTNCTACIDACNRVMNIVKLPKNLIRYTSKNQIETGAQKIFTPRVIGYTIVLSLLISIITLLFLNRKDIEVTILRTPGVMTQVLNETQVANLYDLKVINKTFDTIYLDLFVTNKNAEIRIIGEPLNITENQTTSRKFLIILNKEDVKELNTEINIDVKQKDKMIGSYKSNFLGLFKKENL